MKSFLLSSLLLFFCCKSYACSCEYIPSFCEVSKTVSEHENGLIWIGEVVAVDTIDEFTVAYQLELLEIFYGEVIEGPTLNQYETEYINTESLIWVLGGNGSLCLREIQDGKSLFANINYEGNGYVPAICWSDYFAIEEDDTFSGAIWSMFGNEVASVDDIEDIILETCTTSVEDLEQLVNNNITITENPFQSELAIYANGIDAQGLQIEIMDPVGRLIHQEAFSGNFSMDTSNLPSGIYFLSFTKDRFRFTKKIIKQ